MRRMIEQQAFDEIGWVSARHHQLNFGGAITVETQPALTVAGIGDALAQQLLPEFTYTNPQPVQELLSRLRKVLKQTDHVIVVDN